MRVLDWLRTRDRGLAALRRAGRTAIVMPALFALGDKVIGNADLATFAAFGSFALLLLVDFGGPLRDRAQAQLGLGIVGAAFVCLGSLAARNPWLAGGAMAVVGFAVLFSGVVSSVVAGATTALLLSFILPVSLDAPTSAIPYRLAGWGMATGVSVLAIVLLWPAPASDPLRAPAVAAIRALAGRIRAGVVWVTGQPGGPAAREQAAAEAGVAINALQGGFLASPYRPTGLTTSARTLVRLVDELTWLDAILRHGDPKPMNADDGARRDAIEVKQAGAAVLDAAADLLDPATASASPTVLIDTADRLVGLRDQLEASAATLLPSAAEADATGPDPGAFISSLEPTFRAQELSYAVLQIAGNVHGTIEAERRSGLDRLLGRQPAGVSGPLAAAQERAAAHVERHSVWLHNSIRGAIALGLAVLIASESGLQHSFWVVLGTLSVLRSNALNTGQNAVRAFAGTVVGFVVGGALIEGIGTDETVLWFLLPLAILLAGVAPAAISFAAGQAGFTITLVILFNIIAPAGWRVGLLRVEDIAIGCAVSLVVGILFWPRGAAAALNQALAEAYAASAAYLSAAVSFGMIRCDLLAPAATPPDPVAVRAAAANRRLDDAFRTFLAERGEKPVSLAEVTALVNGVTGLRLAGDAVLDLWGRDDGAACADRGRARAQIGAGSAQVEQWYDDLGRGLIGRAPVSEPLTFDEQTTARLVEALREDLSGADGRATATAVRMVWTSDHVDVARRLQAGLVGPARATANCRRSLLDRITQASFGHDRSAATRPAPDVV
jgi:uncharacterized membrane protein YccC